MVIKELCPKCSAMIAWLDKRCPVCGYAIESWPIGLPDRFSWKKLTPKKEELDTKRKALDRQEAGDHYKKYKIQPVEFCQKNNLPYCESNVIKYVVRHKDKNGLEDLKKAKHYLELIAQLVYGENI